jgi:TetR/AcrR family transcriptional regulator
MVKPSDQSVPGSTAPPSAPDGTEQRILEAADAVFTRRGTDGARMQEIADEAGVNKALLHYYYRSKAQLADAVFRHAARNLLGGVVEVMASDLELEAKVEQVVGRYLDQLSRRPYLPGYLISEVTHHPDRLPRLFAALAGDAVRTRVLAKLEEQLDERVRAGTLAPIAPEQFLINLVSLCVFPFAARPLVTVVLGLDEAGFARFIEQRRAELPAFLMRALRP